MHNAAYAVVWCLCVNPSIWMSGTFVHAVETNKHIFIIFHLLVATHAFLVLLHQMLYQYSDGWFNGGVECSGVGTNRDSRYYLASAGHRPLLDRRMSSTFWRWNIGCSTYTSSVFRDQPTPPRHASVNVVYDIHRRTEPRFAKVTILILPLRAAFSD